MDSFSLDSLLKNEFLGLYYLGKYYFKVNTGIKRAAVNVIHSETEFSNENQRILQRNNIVTIFHEYIHYLHEMSTVVGNVGIAMDLVQRSLFTQWLNNDVNSSESLGNTTTGTKEKYIKSLMTESVILGDNCRSLHGKFVEVNSISYFSQSVYFPDSTDMVEGRIEVPELKFTELIDGKILNSKVFFNKYFIYEGIAYELDRIVDLRLQQRKHILDDQAGTEYTVLRRLAYFIFPQIEKEIYLIAGVLALQFIDCGSAFIKIIESIKEGVNHGISQKETMKNKKIEISQRLAEKREEFLEAQDEYKSIFQNRHQLQIAWEHITTKCKQYYDLRVSNASFEVDLSLYGDLNELFTLVNTCDYMYVFNDEDEFMRDILGTVLSQEISTAMKVHLAHDHFSKIHKFFPTKQIELSNNSCPFFSCCNLNLRKENSEVCKNNPWRIYEISTSSDRLYCWYGQGVLESKGVNIR